AELGCARCDAKLALPLALTRYSFRFLPSGYVSHTPAVTGELLVTVKNPSDRDRNRERIPITRSKSSLPVIDPIQTAETIELMWIVFACGWGEENEQWLTNEKLRGHAEKVPRSCVRFADHASRIGDEIRVGSELEQVVVFLSFDLG